MTRLRALLLIVSLTAVAQLQLTAAAHADEQSHRVRAAVAAVAKSTVRIRMIGTDRAGDLSVTSRVTTGVAISEDGDILTSAFGFTGQSAAVFVEDSAGGRVAAKVVATDHVKKLVLLRCEDGNFVVPKFSGNQWPAVGATAIAAGKMYPGSQPSISVGIISAVKRIFGLAIQTDAKISPVNYGGPLLDIDGNVLGILVPLSPRDSGDDIEAGVEWYDSGIGFAIPIGDALQTVEELRSGNDRVRGVVGVGFSTRNPLETEFAVKVVYPDSPAADGGLEAGDEIVEANGVTVDRFGIFESIVKSSYAGDQMKLLIKRGDENLRKELKLTDKLNQPTRGFVGIIGGDPVKDDEDNTVGVRIRIVPGSPLRASGLPETAILKTWGDKDLQSVPDLTTALQTSYAGKVVDITWTASDDESAIQQSTVEPVKRPETMTVFSNEVIAAVTGTTESMPWKRSEKDLGEGAGKVWMYAPEKPPKSNSGLVVLLSAGERSQEATLNRWKDVCERHNLILVVPVNAEKKGLTREDRLFIQRAVASALATAEGRSIDAARSILVASSGQAEVCTELILQLRRGQFRAAVFVDSWPQVSSVPAAVLAAASPSTLIITGKNPSRQKLALLQQTLKTLREAGAWVVQQAVSDDDEVSAEQHIANWALNLKVR